MKIRKSTVFVVCTVHNGISYTKKMLRCLQKQTYSSLSTIIYDDGSTDGTSDYIKIKGHNIQIISGTGNSWWTGGLFSCVENVFHMAKEGDYILTINNDCTFNSSYIQKLIRLSEKNERAIIGSLAIDQRDKKTIVGSGVRMDWEKAGIYSFGPKYIHQIPKMKTVDESIDTLSTRGTLYPIEVFKKIGNFDKKNFPQYLSDYEFACRAKSKGFKLLLSYKTRIYTDRNNTGYRFNSSEKFTTRLFFTLLFSRKSKVNIIDRLKFISICCPNKYKAFNVRKVFQFIFSLIKRIRL